MKLSETQVIEAIGTLSANELRLWIREGWIMPVSSDDGPVFDEVDVARIRLVCQLRDDLNLKEEVMPVVLSLMDQLYGLRHELRALARAIEHEPEEVRYRIHKAYRERKSTRS